MAVNIFLQIPNIPGDSTTKGFANQFELMSYSWGVSNTSTNAGSGKPNFTSLNVMTFGGSHAPSLMLATAAGTRVGTLVLSFTTTTGTGAISVVATYTLTNAFIQSYQESGSEGGGPPTVSMSFGYSKIDFKQYKANKDGTTTLSDDRFWDLQANKGG